MTEEIKRPTLFQYQDYAETPKYVNHNYKDDLLAILACQIKIWAPQGKEWFNIPSVTANECLVIREVSSIEITDSYKDLIGKAVVKFPRGTVIEKRKKQSNVIVGEEEDGTQKTDTLKNTTANADVITPQTARYSDDNIQTTSMAAHYDDKGLIDFNRSKTEAALLNPGDVAIGNRIEIRLGYAYSEKEFEKMKKGEGKDNNLELVFTGFITSVSVSTPLELECENMAHILATYSVPKTLSSVKSLKINEYFGSGDTKDLLAGTGLDVSASTKEVDIVARVTEITSELTVSDVLHAFSKAGIMSFMKNDNATGKSTLRIGRVYYAGKEGNALPNNDKNYITYNGGNRSLPIIQFDWDVANDGLSLIRNEKKYLAVEAYGYNADGDMFKLVLRKSPDSDDGGWAVSDGDDIDFNGQFQVVNERKYKKKQKRKGGSGKKLTKDGNVQNRVNLKLYNKVEYHSIAKSITRDQLIAEAKQYWEHYTPNGISGSLTLFGDLSIHPAMIVGLVDQRQPEKNGYYLVESVNITFDTNGYRKELKLPHKIATFKGAVIETIEI